MPSHVDGKKSSRPKPLSLGTSRCIAPEIWLASKAKCTRLLATSPTRGTSERLQPPPLFGRILQLPIIGAFLFQLLAGTRKSLRDFLVNDVWYSKPTVEEAVLRDMQRAINSPGGKAAAYASMMRMTSPSAVRDFTHRFSELSVHAHLIWGDHDKLFPLETCGRTLQKLIRGATLDVIKDSGHEPMVEAPSQFLEILRTIVQR